MHQKILTLFLVMIVSLFCPYIMSEAPPNQDQQNPYFQDPPTPLFEDAEKELDIQEYSFYREFFRMIVVLGLMIAVVIGISLFLKRMLNSRVEQMNITSNIKILERRSVGPKSSIYVLEILGKGIVIGESVNGLTKLTEISLEEDGNQQTKDKSFGQILDKQ